MLCALTLGRTSGLRNLVTQCRKAESPRCSWLSIISRRSPGDSACVDRPGSGRGPRTVLIPWCVQRTIARPFPDALAPGGLGSIDCHCQVTLFLLSGRPKFRHKIPRRSQAVVLAGMWMTRRRKSGPATLANQHAPDFADFPGIAPISSYCRIVVQETQAKDCLPISANFARGCGRFRAIPAQKGCRPRHSTRDPLGNPMRNPANSGSTAH